LNVIYIQAKRWEGTVMVPKVPFKGAIPLHTLISRANIVERVCCVSLDRPEEPTPQVVQLEGLATDAAVGTLTVKVRAYLSTYHLRAEIGLRRTAKAPRMPLEVILPLSGAGSLAQAGTIKQGQGSICHDRTQGK
jgi:hypothetical protein